MTELAKERTPVQTRSPQVRRRRKRIGTDLDIVTGRRDRLIIYTLLGITAAAFAFPLFSAVKKSLAINGLGNYVALFTDPLGTVPIWQTYVNSLLVGVVHATVVVFVSVTAGYAFSKLAFRGRDIAYAAVILFLAIPGIAILVPVYKTTEVLGLFNNFIGIGLPEAAITIPFGILLVRNHARNVPDSLTEAAQIDGAGHYRIFWSIFLPLARPAIVNLTVLCFIWSMQDFLWPSFLVTNPKFTTAALAVQTYSNVLGRGAETLAKYNASLVLLAVPALLFVLFGLRFIVNGLTSGASKE